MSRPRVEVDRLNLGAAVKVWTLCGAGTQRIGQDGGTLGACIVSELAVWGVPRASAWRWYSHWVELCAGRELMPATVKPDQLRRLVLAQTGRMTL